MEVYPTHPITHHVHTLRSGVSAVVSLSGFFQWVLEDDESKACSPPTPDRHKIRFFLSHSIQNIHTVRDSISRRHLGRKEEGV